MDRERTSRGSNARGLWFLFALRRRNYGLVCGIENAPAGRRTARRRVARLGSDARAPRVGLGGVWSSRWSSRVDGWPVGRARALR